MTTREYAQTIELLVAPRHRARGRRAGTRRRGRRREGALDGRSAPRAAAATRGGSASTSRSRMPRTSCRWSRARSESRRRTPSTTSSRASSTDSAAAQRRRVVVPDAIPQDRARPPRSPRVEGAPLSRAEGGVLPPRIRSRPVAFSTSSASSASASLVVVRTPPDVSLYHRHGNPLFGDVLERLGRDPAVQAVVLPRTDGAAGRDRRARRFRPSSCPSTRSTRRASSRSRTSSSRQAGR